MWNRSAIEVCRVIGEISLLMVKLWFIRRMQQAMLITKSEAARWLAFKIPSPPSLMLRWVMSVEYVGRGWVVSRVDCRNDWMVESIVDSIGKMSVPIVPAFIVEVGW